MVSTSVMNFLMEFAVLSFVFPVVILLTWRLRTRKNLLPALAGALVFLLFAKLLETIPYALFVGMDNPLSRIVRSSEILYALYQGIAAAVFEETGRYLAFRYFLPKYGDSRQTAITYGIGHGGVECMAVLGLTNLQYYMCAAMMNGREELLSELPSTMVEELSGLTVSDCIFDVASALIFIVLQIALSILIFQVFRNEALRRRLFCYAMLFHVLAYLPSGFYHAGLISHLAAVVLQLFVAGFTVWVAASIYKKMGEAEKERAEERRKRMPSEKDKSWAFAAKKLSNIEEECTPKE
jgi:uncharacterized membrane protein YhfC